MSHDRTCIRHAIEALHFGFLTDDEIRAMSMKQITSHQAYDTMMHPLPGGLYDPALGPMEAFVHCVTCGQDFNFCGGHLGHIELSATVYHPMLFQMLYKLLRGKCMACNKLRMSALRARVFAVKIMLCNAGEAEKARDLDDELNRYSEEPAVEGGEKKKKDEKEKGSAATGMASQTLQGYEDRLKGTPYNPIGCRGHDRTYRREVIEAALKAMQAGSRCDNCGMRSPAVRKDGHNKLFSKPLSTAAQRANQRLGKGKARISALKTMERRREGINDEQEMDSDSDAGGEIHSEDESEDEEKAPVGENDAEEDEGTGAENSAKEKPKKGEKAKAAAGVAADSYWVPLEVENQMKLLWEREWPLLSALFGLAQRPMAPSTLAIASDVSDTPNSAIQNAVWPAEEVAVQGYHLFFLRLLVVTPNRFRPAAKVGDITSEHPQNTALSKAIQLSERLQAERAHMDAGDAAVKAEATTKYLSLGVELQDAVNAYMDSSKDPRASMTSGALGGGLRQALEKKEGLFRKHMMGKRVNFACRSVISPDPYVGTSEIGIPLRFAKVLTYPQPVATWNVAQLRSLVEAGADSYPGANYIEDVQGRLTDLRRLNPVKRQAEAAKLLTSKGKKVWRHMHDGDVMLVNRQPTLHKPGIMAHRVRVMKAPSYQTIRMHYANCNTYNADFDGDEINCHLPQDEISRAEAAFLAYTDQQYIVPTNGKPLRGLIQDHVDAGVKLCSKGSFLTREEMQQLIYQALAGLPGLEIVPLSDRIETPQPAIVRPKELWTGKQVISTVLQHLTRGLPQLTVEFKAKTPAVAFGEAMGEHQVLVRGGELLRGILDKSAFGATECGLVHAVQDAYGGTAAGLLLSALGRLLTVYLQGAGHTCGVEDLTLTARAEEERSRLIHEALSKGERAMHDFLLEATNVDPSAGRTAAVAAAAAAAAASRGGPMTEKERENIEKATARLLGGQDRAAQAARVDAHMQGALNPVASEIIKACLPGGQEKPFPKNCFSLMVLTGAKGSNVNHSQISCLLGQQALEGRRVPLMASGKSLPSFEAYDPDPRAGGFITDRFLTGIRPQEYYFHCMAGREGLVDTAVKTSRSGYLQRCLVKHLEELKVAYDGTVRDGEGGVTQFLYGEDGIDPVSAKYLDGQAPQMGFCARNHRALSRKYALHAGFLKHWGFDVTKAMAAHKAVRQARLSGNGDDSDNVWATGTKVSARKPFGLKAGATEDWKEGTELLPGWESAEVVKAHYKPGHRPKYTVRYLIDSSVVRKLPLSHKTTTAAATLPKMAEEMDDAPGPENEGLPPAAAGAAAAESSSPIPKDSQQRLKRKEVLLRAAAVEPTTAVLRPTCDIGCVSEKFEDALDGYIAANPSGYLASSTIFISDAKPATTPKHQRNGKGKANTPADATAAEALRKQDSLSRAGAANKTPKETSKAASVNKATTKAASSTNSALTYESLAEAPLSGEAFRVLMWLKYMRSMAEPGEAVGSIAAQSIGEPSTQMTLNTFHLAGHGGANVTLGIPRLREILMTAARKPKTPFMTVPFEEGVPRVLCESLARQLMRLPLADLLQSEGGVVVQERLVVATAAGDGAVDRQYEVTLRFQPGKLIKSAFHLSFQKLCRSVGSAFAVRLLYLIRREFRLSGETAAAKLCAGAKEAPIPSSRRSKIDKESVEKKSSKKKSSKKAKEAAEENNENASPDALGDMAGGPVAEDEATPTTNTAAKRKKRSKNGAGAAAAGADGDANDVGEQEDLITVAKKSRKREQESTMDDDIDDDEAQGTLKFGEKKEMATYGEMDEEDEEIARSARRGDDLIDSDADDNEPENPSNGNETDGGEGVTDDENDAGDAAGGGSGGGGSGGGLVEVAVPPGVEAARIFEGIKADKRRGTASVFLRVPATVRRVLMAGLAESAAEQGMVRAYPGISRAYVVEKIIGGKERLALQTEGCDFSTIWALSARADACPNALNPTNPTRNPTKPANSSSSGSSSRLASRGVASEAAAVACARSPLDLTRLESNHVFAVLQSYGVEAARATLVREVAAVFDVYGIAVDKRHLGLVADYLTHEGGYKALNRAGMADASSPCLQMSFETTAQFLVAAALYGKADYLGSPSARIVVGRVGEFGTGLCDMLVPVGASGVEAVAA